MDLSLREYVHRQIILDLTKRTLERDSRYIEQLKISRVLKLWIDQKINLLHGELKVIKKELYKKGIKLQSEHQGDDGFTEYVFLERGTVEKLRYSNIALRNWVDEEVKRLLDLEHRTTASGDKPV